MRAPWSSKEYGPRVDWRRGAHSLACCIISASSFLAPEPDISLSQWADSNRMLSAEGSAEQGKWSTDRAPYQREMMDVLTQPGIREAVYMLSSQTGKTELELNILGYFMHYRPCPILIVYPTLDMGKAYSKTRLAPMIRDTPCLKGLVKEARSRDSGNTLMMKSFPGGHLIIAGSNSPASLSSYPIRVVLCDEIDRFADSAGAEGDPVELAFQRTRNFWNHLRICVGTPTIKNDSPIEKRFMLSDQRYRYVPCPHCHEHQILQWENVHWDKDEDGTRIEGTEGYACAHCGAVIDLDVEKHWMDANGKWIAHNPKSSTPGFTINSLYSPWVTLKDLVDEFFKKKALGKEGLKTFWNTLLARTWDPQAHQEIPAEGILKRREAYTAQVPWGVGYLTAAVDVQGNRLEMIVKGWGRNNESWLIHREAFYGSPALTDVWKQLDERLQDGYRHASGRLLFIHAGAVDLGGQFSKEAYAFAKPRIPRRIFPIRGNPRPATWLIKKSKSQRSTFWLIGTNTAKDTILDARIKTEQPGPGYMHFPDTSPPQDSDAPWLFGEDWCDLDYFKQLVNSEHKVRTQKGRLRIWEKISSETRNEALDLEVYNWAIWSMLKISDKQMDERLAFLEQPLSAAEASAPEPPKVMPAPRRKKRRNIISKGLFER